MSKKSKEIELVYSAPENTPVSNKGYFVSPIDKKWVTKQNSDLDGQISIMLLGSTFTVTGSMVGGGLVSLSTLMESIGTLGLWGGVVSFTLAGLSACILPVVKKYNRTNKAINYAQNFNANLIKDWLLKKYNLIVDDKNAYKLSGYVTELKLVDSSQEFSDSKGIQYKLEFMDVNGVKEYFVVSANAGKSDELALKASVDSLALSSSNSEVEQGKKEEPFKSFFSGEATTLHSSIVTRIQKLNTMGVDADKQYTLNFIAEELLSVVKLHERAAALGSEESVQKQTVAVLSDLNDELDKLIISELADIERQFAIKRSHLSERKMGSNSSIKAIESLSEKESNRA
jgi:hypothetical protein